jgi:DNA repair exonuclease SbcCD nuclease subunit
MTTFIHAADIHLDSPLKGLEVHDDAPAGEIRNATRRAFDNLVDLALGEPADFLLIAGDLFDGDWKDYNTGLFFADRMGRLSRAGIRVFIVSGNHDAAGRITRALPLPPGVTLFGSRTAGSVILEDLGVAIHGRSYPSRAVTENLAAGFPQGIPGLFNIGLLHTCLTGRDGHEVYAPCTPDDLRSKGYDYWALGHVHNREVVESDPWIVFPGNIQGRHIRETGPRGATRVTVEEGRVTGVEEVCLDVLRWAGCRVDLTGCDTPEAVHEAVRRTLEEERARADGRPLALRLTLDGACPVHHRLMERIPEWTGELRAIAAGAGEVWLEKVLFRTRRTASSGTMPTGGHPGKTSMEETPVQGLIRSLEGMELDGEALLALVPELTVLKSKLPAEIHGPDDPFPDVSPPALADLLTEVREMLAARLLAKAGAR